MASICAVEVEGRKFSYEMVRCPPDLHMRIMRDSNISGRLTFSGGIRPKLINLTYFPSGENLIAFTGFWKLKWCSTAPRLKFTSNARPSAAGSTDDCGAE